MPVNWILRLSALLGMLALAAPGLGVEPSFTWKLAPTAEIPAEVAASEPTSWEVEVDVRDPNRILCVGGRYVWEINGAPVRARRRGLCSFSLEVARLGAHRIQLATAEGNRPPVAHMTASVTLKELVVVVMGDSVASGDGTPARRFLAVPRWRDRECGRSDAAGSVAAIASLEAQDPATAIRVIDVACSGAGIASGLLGPQGATATSAQVVAAATALKGRAPSAILITAGANDAGFADLIRTCLVDESRQDCRGLASAPGRPPLAQEIPQRLSRLPGLYGELAACLSGRECSAGARLAVAPRRVLIASYFDPTRDEQGRTCRWPRPDLTRAITSAEMAWSREALLQPLNRAVASAAEAHGWTHLSAPAEAFATHGVCARQPWVIAPQLSLLRQGDLRGSFHPDSQGQECYRRSFAGALAPILAEDGLSATPPPDCTP